MKARRAVVVYFHTHFYSRHKIGMIGELRATAS